MINNKRNKIQFLGIFLSFLLFPLFAEVKIISPCKGEWANKQSLVLETTDGETVFYSFSGTDPAISGFAYDEPVLIDVTGNVELRLNVLPKKSKAYQLKVNYSVIEPAENTNEDDVISFVKKIKENVITQVLSGTSFSIPKSLQYKLQDESRVFENGRDLICSKDSLLEKYTPCIVKNDNQFYRFVIRSVSESHGELSIRDVPFKITNWTTINFTDSKLIYSIDGALWRGSGTVENLDRSVSHMVQWQSVAYDETNPIQFAIIPAKPRLKILQNNDNSVSILIEGDESYRMAGAKNSALSVGQFQKITLDTYHGDYVKDTLHLDLFSDNIYQGSFSAAYEISRRKPSSPKISANSESEYSRQALKIKIEADENSQIFYSISEPIKIKPSFNMANTANFFSNNLEYKLYDGHVIEISSDTENVFAYSLSAYTLDKWGTKSDVITKTFTVDLCNFFFDSDSKALNPDGSPFAPYKDLEKLMEVINARRFTRVFIKGQMSLKSSENIINSNCEIIGKGTDSRIIIPTNAFFVIQNSLLEASNIIFEKKAPDLQKKSSLKEEINLFTLKRATLNFNNSEVISFFENNGNVFSATESSLVIKNSGITANADSYASCVSAIDSDVVIKNCRITAVAPTAVNFSLKKGNFVLSDSSLSISGNIGRIAELVGTSFSAKNNTFTAELNQKNKSLEPIWQDKDSVCVELVNNKMSGF